MTDDDPAPLLAEADELYGLAPGDFTAARDARSRALKKDDPGLAASVKALRKPSTAAWLVDQLVRRDPAAVDDLLRVGEALREAQATLSADDLRAFTKQRRQLTASVTTRARALGRELGTRVTEAVAEQVEGTLTAAMLDEGAGAAVRSGLLVAALRPAGMDAVEVEGALAHPAALGHEAPAAPEGGGSGGDGPGGDQGPVLQVVPDPDAQDRAVEEAREQVAAAEDVLGEAEAELADLDEEVEDLEARGMQAQARVDELRTRLAEATERQSRVEDQLAEAEEAQGEQRDVVAAARAERDEALARLRRLTGE
ncbi:hypothetical protein RDV89_15455 [Nocardioides zeae]|uniref:Transposase n=1 Tax=Nocardioides imazamoxiresistens TaxID=3231893 RepID=A0ABU3Q0E3_9ACTN|nr:hypothetical protein [Nocardioides zeae]MDT9594480.1 hypothetical protein [Nocardioides zeae]